MLLFMQFISGTLMNSSEADGFFADWWIIQAPPI